MANQQEIQDLIDKTDIVSLVSRYVKLEKQGKNYRGLCPFHSENTPSFLVSPDKNVAHCFGCGGGGNPLNFLMQIEKLDFKDAVKKLAEINGVKLSGFDVSPRENSLSKYFNIMQTSVNFYMKNLEMTQDGIKAKEYLHKRGLTDEIIKDFQIGLSPKPGDSLYQVLKNSGHLELDVTDVGLIDKGDRGYYDLFSSRIMFPIFNESGSPVGFSARIFDPSQNGQPKYINSRDTILFKKNQSFFNIQHAKGEMLKKKRCILHEGQMDVLASYRSGLKEAICSMGTALSPLQASIIAKYTKSIVICFDGDKAGIKASLKAINIFKAQGFDVHLVLLPNGMDPDEYVLKYGSEAYLQYFETNIIDANAYIFKQALLNKDFNDSSQIDLAKNEIFSMLSKASSTEKDKYLRTLAEKLNTTYQAVLSDFNSYCSMYGITENVDKKDIYQDYSYKNESIYEAPKRINEIKSNCEIRLFMYAKSSKEKAMYIDSVLNDRMEALSRENQKLWITLINSFYENYNEFNEAAFIKMLSDEDVTVYLSNINKLKLDKNPYTDTDLNECLAKLLEIKYDKENKKLSKKLNETDNFDNQTAILENKFANLRKKDQLKKNRRN